jgi:dipeptidase D
LFEVNKTIEIRIHAIHGGGLRNAIPRESFATIWVADAKVSTFLSIMNEMATTLQQEYRTTDPSIEVEWTKVDGISTVLGNKFQNKLLRSIYACPNGIYRMSPDIKDLVQTSNNLARVEVANGKYEILNLTRSSVDSEKEDEVAAIQSTFELMGATVTTDGDYPGWEPRPNAGIVSLMDNLYTEMFGKKANVNACHAGLECGILGTNYPEMEMISFGPNIRGAHSPDEKVQISSVQKTWDLLLEALKRID